MSKVRPRVVAEGWQLEDEDRRLISDAFAEAGLEGVKPEQAKQERQSTAEWVVIAVPLLPFVQAIATKAGEGAYAAMKRLIHRLRDSGGHGGRRTVELHDSSTGMKVDLRDGDLPDAAWRALSETKTSLGPIQRAREGLIWNSEGSRSRPERLVLEWSDQSSHWLVHPGELGAGGERIGRRLPIIPAREPLADPSFPDPLDLSSTEVRHSYLSPTWEYLLHYLDPPASAISTMRARFVGWFNFGNQPEDIARQLVCSRELVNAVLDDFARHGRKALEPDFADSRAPSAFTLRQHEEIVEFARRFPRRKRTSKRAGSLSDFLVREGVVEDINLADLKSLLAREGIRLSP
jgi:hypothetical protein